jgi:xylulokinase
MTSTDLRDLTLAVLEGVAYSLCDGLDTLCAAGAQLTDVSLIGGGARSRLWRQILADALDMPLEYCAGSDVGPGLGVARLAMIGAAADDVEAIIHEVCTQPPREARHDPQTARTAYHREKLARYRELYACTKALHQHDQQHPRSAFYIANNGT